MRRQISRTPFSWSTGLALPEADLRGFKDCDRRVRRPNEYARHDKLHRLSRVIVLAVGRLCQRQLAIFLGTELSTFDGFGTPTYRRIIGAQTYSPDHNGTVPAKSTFGQRAESQGIHVRNLVGQWHGQVFPKVSALTHKSRGGYHSRL